MDPSRYANQEELERELHFAGVTRTTQDEFVAAPDQWDWNARVNRVAERAHQRQLEDAWQSRLPPRLLSNAAMAPSTLPPEYPIGAILK